MKVEVRRAGLLLLAASILFLIAYQAPTDLFFDFGPNDGDYVTGFRKDFEIDEPTLIHWSLRRGRVRLPVILPRGPFDISFRYKRHIALPAQTTLFVANEQVDRFPVPQQDFQVRTVTVSENARPWTPLDIVFLSRSSDPRPLGLALDWLRILPSGPVLPAPAAFLYLLGTVLGLYVFPRLIGFSSRVSLSIATGGTVALAIGTAFHKLAWLQASTQLGLRPHVISFIVIAFFLVRRRNRDSAFSHPLARWAMLAFYLGTTVRLLALFHPDFYYPDVRTHSKFVSIIWTEGLAGFFMDHIPNQHRHLLGLQRVGEEWKAFPYPPLLYLSIYPLSLLRLPVEDWMKIVPTVLAGIESLIVYVMALRLGASSRAGVAASWIHATAPLLVFRLTVASYAALFGHFWDMLVALYLLFRFGRMEQAKIGIGLALPRRAVYPFVRGQRPRAWSLRACLRGLVSSPIPGQDRCPSRDPRQPLGSGGRLSGYRPLLQPVHPGATAPRFESSLCNRIRGGLDRIPHHTDRRTPDDRSPTVFVLRTVVRHSGLRRMVPGARAPYAPPGLPSCNWDGLHFPGAQLLGARGSAEPTSSSSRRTIWCCCRWRRSYSAISWSSQPTSLERERLLLSASLPGG